MADKYEKPQSSQESLSPDMESYGEKQPVSPEVNPAQERKNKEEALHDAREQVEDLASDQSAEQLKIAQGAEKQPEEPFKATSKRQGYNRTMSEVRKELPGRQALMSRIIHNRVIETSSDLVGKTVLRPLPVMLGGLFASVMTLGVYVVARRYGYEISGSGWFIASIAAGYAVGLVLDLIRMIFTRKKLSH